MRGELGRGTGRLQGSGAVVFAVALLGTLFVPTARAEDPPEFSWIRQFGTSVDDVVWGLTSDGSGIYVVGRTDGALPGQIDAGGSDGFLRKYDFSGREQWTRQFGSPAEDGVWSVASDGTSVYVYGFTFGTLPGQTSAGGMDAFLRKYDPGGGEVWTLQFGTALDDAGYAVGVHSTGVYVTGWTYGAFPGQSHTGAQDSFLRKYDSGGNAVWTREFGTAAWDGMTDAYVDDTGVYVTGWVEGALPGQTWAGDYDVYVRKYDHAGLEQWTDEFGSSLSDHPEGGLAADGTGVYVSGQAVRELPGQTSVGASDAFLRKYDRDGTVLWTRQFGTPTYDGAWGSFADGSGVHVTGATWGAFPGSSNAGDADIFVRKYDSGGTEVWTRQFGTPGNDIPWSMATAAGGLYLAGHVTGSLPSQTAVGQQDAFAMKLGGTPAADASPGTLPFGGLDVGETAFGNVTVASVGTAFLTVTAISLALGTQGYAIENAPPTPFLLPPQTTAEVMISFAPSLPGSAADTLRVSSNDPLRGTIDVPLTGTGFVVPRIEVTPGALTLGSVEMGTTTTGDVTIRSVGSGSLTIASTSLLVGGSGFSIDASPPSPVDVPPGDSATIRIGFSPNAVGPRTDTLRIVSNDPGRLTVDVPLSGEGFVVPDIDSDPRSLDFGSVELGTAASRTLSISSVRSGDVTVTDIALASRIRGFEIFAAPATPFVLRPGASAEVEITFAPTATGSAGDALTILSDDPSEERLEVPLYATGVDTTPPQVAHVPPGAARVGQSISVRVTVTDFGGVGSVVLYYRVSGETEFRMVTMDLADGVHIADIPPQARAVDISYHVVARDMAGNEAREPGEGFHVVRVSTEPTRGAGDSWPNLALLASLVLVVVILLLAAFVIRRRRQHPRKARSRDRSQESRPPT